MSTKIKKAETIIKGSPEWAMLQTFTDQEKFTERSVAQIARHRETGAPEDEITFMELTVHGGNCSRCLRPFVDQEVKNAFSDYVQHVPDCECWEIAHNKEVEAIDGMVKYINAKIPKHYIQTTFKNWNREDVEQATNTAFQDVMGYVRARKYDSHGMILFGDIGTGKTMLAIAVIKHLMDEHDSKCVYVSMSDLIHNAINSGDDFAMGLREYEYVLFDDIDKIGYDRSRKENAWINELLFRVFDGILSAGRKIIATCNYQDIGDFQKQYDAPIVSRIIEKCEFIHFTGSDYRITRRRKENGK